MPSVGTGMVEAIGDTDRDVVVKVTDKANQKVKFIQTDGTHTNIQFFDLRGLTLVDELGA